MDIENSLKLFQKKIKIKFKNLDLLKEALTHRSFSTVFNNERLEFFGDAVISLIISKFIFKKFPRYDEGKLTKMRSMLVSENFLYNLAKEIELGKYIFMSENEKKLKGDEKKSILADCFESVIGGIFLNSGYAVTEKFYIDLIKDKTIRSIENPKSKIQELIQKKHKVCPVYVVKKEEGEEHDKVFTIECKVKNRTIGVGSGKSKKEAEFSAAKNALKKIRMRKINKKIKTTKNSIPPLKKIFN